VVERVVGAERTGAGELVVAAARHPDGRAEALRDLQRGEGDAAADPPDQDVLARPQLRPRDEHAPRRQRRQRERRGLLGRHRRRHAPHAPLRDDDVLGEEAREMLAVDLVARAERLLAVEAVLARAAARPRVDDDAVAGPHGRHARPDRVDDAGSVGPDDPRRRDRDVRQPADDEQVEVVERRGLDAHAHVGRLANLGRREVVAILELIEGAVSGDRESAHLPNASRRVPTARATGVAEGKRFPSARSRP
jgi:hypothetical protein